MLKLGVSLADQQDAPGALMDWLLAIDGVVARVQEEGRSSE